MQGGTPRGDHISTEASLQAPSVATVMDGPEAASVREKGIWLLSMYTYRTRYGLHLFRVELAVFTLGARRRPPDSHRPRRTSQAGHLDDPGVGAQLAT